MATLNVNIGALELKNPVMTASGTFGYGLEFADLVPLDEIGGIIVKGTTLKPRQGNDYPRMAETPQGMLNCVGLQNKGVDYFCSEIYPKIKDIDSQMIVNVSGSSPEDYAECARRVGTLDNIRAIELNISCRQQQNATHRLVPSVSVSIVSVQVGLVQRKCREANLAHIILHPIREVMVVQYRAARHFL